MEKRTTTDADGSASVALAFGPLVPIPPIPADRSKLRNRLAALADVLHLDDLRRLVGVGDKLAKEGMRIVVH